MGLRSRVWARKGAAVARETFGEADARLDAVELHLSKCVYMYMYIYIYTHICV